MTSYLGLTLSHTLDTTTDPTLVPGALYQLKFRARNLIGYSPFSPVLRVALSTKIPAPVNLRADLPNTGPNYITIQWNQVVYPELPTTGYTVEMLIDSIWTEVKNAQYD